MTVVQTVLRCDNDNCAERSSLFPNGSEFEHTGSYSQTIAAAKRRGWVCLPGKRHYCCDKCAESYKPRKKS